jgi:hypothetical protein
MIENTTHFLMKTKPIRPALGSTHAAVRLSPRGILSTLVVLIGLAYLSSTLAQIALIAGGYPIPNHVIRLLNLSDENNLPTWLSSTNLLICAVLVGLIAKVKWAQCDAYRFHWFGLCLTFFYLSVDEAASIHEATVGPVRTLVGASGAFFAAWVIPAMIAVSIFSLLYLRFLFALPRRVQALFVLAGGLYVIGGIGVEMLSWHYRFPMYDPENVAASRDLTYTMINHVEELLEMLGVAVFIYALLSYMGMNRISASISISPAGKNAGPLCQ